MANRLAHKPNPAIKKNVIRARSGAKSARRAQSFLVAASLAATFAGWALFSHQEAEVEAALQQANQAALVSQAQQSDSTSPTPMVTDLQLAAGTPAAVAARSSSR
jgi:hypothetical protein